MSPVVPIHGATSVEIGDQDHQFLTIEAHSELPILITVSGRGVDVRAALVNTDGTAGPFADAPNRRMGIETLLVESPHDNALSIRIERNDQAEAHGTVIVDAVALPLANDADRRRLEAARLEARASLSFSDVTKGETTASAYSEAAKLHETNGDQRHAGIALLQAAGARYLRLNDWRGASELAKRAQRLLDDDDSEALTAFALRVEGAALDQEADSIEGDPRSRDQTHEDAQKRLTEAAEAFLALGMKYEAGYALNYRGVSYLNGGDRVSARADFQQAFEYFEATHDKPAQALSLQSLATMEYEDGRLADAMREFDAALALIPRETDPENYAHTLHNSALPYRVLGRFDEAIARYYEAGRILRQLGDRDGEARALHGLGTTFRYAGDPARAKELLQAAVKLRAETGAKREQAISMFVLGQIEREEGHNDVAIALHDQALALVTAPHDRAQALLALAQDYIAAKDLAKARQELESILKLSLPRTHRYLGLALTELGTVESLEGNATAADGAFAGAIAIQQANGSELEQAQTLYRRAEAKMRTGDTTSVHADASKALKLFEEVGLLGTQAESRASFRATYRDVIELQIAAYLADSEAAQQHGEARDAQWWLGVALATSDQSRAQLLMDSDASGFDASGASPELLAQRKEIYELLAGKRQQRDRLLEAAKPDARQIESLSMDIALLRSKAIVIESRMVESRAVSTIADVPDAGTLMGGVPANTVIAEYFIGDNHSWLFEVRDRVVAVHNLPIRSELERMGRQLHASWRSPTKTVGNRLALSQKLSRSMFGQIAAPRHGEYLLIVPDGVLHLVPITVLAREAWPDMHPGAAVVIPSLSARQAERQRHGSRAVKTLAVIADPIYAANDTRIRLVARQEAPQSDAPLTRSARDLKSLQRLPATAIEARNLLALVSSPAEKLALIGADANRERVMREDLGQYRIVHFATHALADSQDPALATLALSQWDVTGQRIEGALRLYEITNLRLNADLVVLSGCDTAIGREIAGEGPIGLSEAFLRTGAQAVVSTLWQVPDTSTAVLMREFYRQLLAKKRNAPVALQIAQDYVRKQPRWSDPYYWAGFQLISMPRFDRNENAG